MREIEQLHSLSKWEHSQHYYSDYCSCSLLKGTRSKTAKEEWKAEVRDACSPTSRLENADHLQRKLVNIIAKAAGSNL